jgi:hypothetical protein
LIFIAARADNQQIGLIGQSPAGNVSSPSSDTSTTSPRST